MKLHTETIQIAKQKADSVYSNTFAWESLNFMMTDLLITHIHRYFKCQTMAKCRAI